MGGNNSTLCDIIKIWYVGRWWCPELIPDIEKFLPIIIFIMATTIPQKFNIVRYHLNLIHVCGYIMMSRIYSRNWKISSCHHFQNDHHNTAQIKHCPISTTFHMWVDYDVPTLKNFYQSPFWKWPPQFNIVRFQRHFKMATTIPHKFNIVRESNVIMWIVGNVVVVVTIVNVCVFITLKKKYFYQGEKRTNNDLQNITYRKCLGMHTFIKSWPH